MENISQAVYFHPQWVQPKAMQNRFELRAEAHLFAVLEFPKMFGSLATATWAEGCWTFKRVGFFSTKITVRKEGEETDLYVYRPKWTGAEGTLYSGDQPMYNWKVANFWATQFAWLDGYGRPLILFKPGVEDPGLADLFKVQAKVEIQPEAQGLKDLPLLALLGWYLMILHQQDSAAAAAAASA